jgi:hypothetical protein
VLPDDGMKKKHFTLSTHALAALFTAPRTRQTTPSLSIVGCGLLAFRGAFNVLFPYHQPAMTAPCALPSHSPLIGEGWWTTCAHVLA